VSGRIVLSTAGSLGDLHPFIAIALRLQEHGYDAVIATSPDFRDNVLAERIAFHPIGPSRDDILRDLRMDIGELGRRIINDTMFVLEGASFPYLKVTYDDLLPVIDGASLVLAGSLMFSARLAAEKRAVPQMTVALQPMVFMSAYDPPSVSQAPWLGPLLSKLGPVATRVVYGAAKRLVTRRARPLYSFRRELGLPDTNANPLFEGQFSPLGTLATYSNLLGAIRQDYPPNTTITGFAFYDRATHPRSALASELEPFLSSGPPPLVFTLGSLAVEFPGEFYRVSRDVARQLHTRAVLLVGAHNVESYRDERSADVFVCDYAPFSELFPRAQAIIHHGGIGTIGQALRAGKPQLLVPFHSDQFDNAVRAERLGVARSVGLKQYVPGRVAAELSSLLNKSGYISRAAAVGREVCREDGTAVVARIVDGFLSSPAPRP
jgi:rhamnosyltransferase subunit B